MRTIQNRTFDEERALYGCKNILVRDCTFDGPADGESAFKECTKVQVEHSFFNLRYPFWHDEELRIKDSEMTELCRALCGIPNTLRLWIPNFMVSKRCGNAVI